MAYKSIFSRSVIALCISVIITLITFAAPASAAAKLATPEFTAAKISENKVALKWSKVKGAKVYQLYTVGSKTYWKLIKTVKKTAANKKKYADTAKYKLKVSGKYYKVYTKAKKYVYTRICAQSGIAYTFKGKYSTKYTFTLKAVNGKKESKLAKFKTVTTGKKMEPQPAQYTLNYNLKGGTAASAYPQYYTEGEGFCLQNPIKESCIFKGWFTDSSFTQPLPEDTTTLTGNLTLYAKWRKIQFCYPVPGHTTINCGFYGYPNHNGVDFSDGSIYGATVVAADSGTVIKVSYLTYSYGYHIFIYHGNSGLTTQYCHLSAIDVIPGQTVKKGEPIGAVGSTGNSTGPHLHFGVFNSGGKFLNPEIFFESLQHDSKKG